MKYAILIICALLLLTGCGGTPVDTDRVTAPAPAVTDNCGWYKLQVEALEARLVEKDKDIANMNNQAMQLSSELQTTKLALGIQKSIQDQQLAEMTALINRMGIDYVVDTTTIDAFNEQYLASQERMKVITDAFDTVKNKAVIIQSGNITMALSANLTVAEYNAFYKGWDLWWWTFNEKDED